jgi:hypothetical protein
MEGDFDAIISGAVELLNIYKNYIEIDLYFAEYVVLCFLGITAQERRKYAATCVCDAAEGRLRR